MLEPQSLVELACEEIRTLIATGALEPGERVYESHLLETLQISRSPLREALRILETQHVLQLVPRRGYTVAPLSQHDIDEIYALRGVLENFALSLILPRLAECDLSALEETVARMRKAAQTGNDIKLFKVVLDFHIALVELSENTRLKQSYKLLMDQMQLYVFWDVSAEARSTASLLAGYRRHALVLESLKSGNAKAIELAFKAHGERRHLESADAS